MQQPDPAGMLERPVPPTRNCKRIHPLNTYSLDAFTEPVLVDFPVSIEGIETTCTAM
jgi:hypothetical protein